MRDKEEELQKNLERHEEDLKKIDAKRRAGEEETMDVQEMLRRREEELVGLKERIGRWEKEHGSCDEVLRELRKQVEDETKRKVDEERKSARLKDTINQLETEVQNLKSKHEKENKRLHVVINDLETEVTREAANLRDNVLQSKRLKAELEEEKRACRNLNKQLDTTEDKAREMRRGVEQNTRDEKRRQEEDSRRISVLVEKLDDERRRRSEAEKKLDREKKSVEKDKHVGLMLQDLEFETSTLKKHNSGLENELIKTKTKLNNLGKEDVANIIPNHTSLKSV